MGILDAPVVTATRTRRGKSYSRVYDVRDYGTFLADAITAPGASITTGTATLTVSGASFTSADVGKGILVPGGAASGGDLKTTIAAYVSGTQVTLSAAASTSVTGKTVLYGTKNDTAIQAAINQANTDGGGIVEIPGGPVYVHGRVVPKSKVWVRGAGERITALYVANESDYLFYTADSTNGIVDFKLSDMTIDVNNTYRASAMQFQYATRLMVSNVRILNVAPLGWGAVIGAPALNSTYINKQITFEKCYFGAIDSTLEQLLIMNTQDIRVVDCNFQDQIASNGPGIGIYQVCDNVVISNSVFRNIRGPAIYYSLSTNNISVDNCQFYGPATLGGTGVQGANLSDNGNFGAGYVYGLRVTNCYFTALVSGVQLGATKGAVVDNCVFEKNWEIGIHVNGGNQGTSATPTYWVVSNCIFRNNNQENTNATLHPAIFVANPGGNLYARITGCKFWDDGPGGINTQYNPITFYANAYDYVHITGNHIHDYTGLTLPYALVDGASIGANVIVDSNYINTANHTAYFVTAHTPGVFNVKNYGAKGDGSSIDTTSVTSAITDLNAVGGGILLFPRGGNYVLDPSIQISSNTHIINEGTITLNPAYVNTTSVFKGIFRLGGTGGTDIIDNVEIEGGLVVGDAFTAYTDANPTFNANNHKYVCYVHSVATHRNVKIHDVKVINMGSPVTLEKLAGNSGTPSRNVHVYNVVEEQVWVGVQYYGNGYQYEDCSVHDIDVKFCYDDCVAIVGATGGIGGAAGLAQRIQVYNIRGEKTGQLGAFVKLDATGGKLVDIKAHNLTGYTQGVNEYIVGIIGATANENRGFILDGLFSQGRWNYGVYAQTNGRAITITNFDLEALFDIHFQGNATPNSPQTIKIAHGVMRSRDASLADNIEGHGIGFSAGTGSQGFQNVKVYDVDTWDKGKPINEGSSRTLTDGAASSVTNPNRLTSATANFSSKDLGYQISIAGAGPAGATLNTTITAIINSTTVVLGTNVSTTVSGALFTVTYVPGGSGTTATLSNIMYDIDIRNSATTDSSYAVSRATRFYQHGQFLSDSVVDDASNNAVATAIALG